MSKNYAIIKEKEMGRAVHYIQTAVYENVKCGGTAFLVLTIALQCQEKTMSFYTMETVALDD